MIQEGESMPRKAREKSGTGIYHIMMRGADRRIVFSDDEDCTRFLETVQKVKNDSDFEMFAYCLMGNHIHLLMRENTDPLKVIFKRIGSSYVYYYNWKYQLHGHLFQDRFRSENIEDDAYFLDVLRYICQNPVKAGLINTPFDYRWLGCGRVTTDDPLVDDPGELIDMSRGDLLSFVGQPCQSEHLEDTGMKRLTDREAVERLCALCKCSAAQEIGGWNEEQQEKAIQIAHKNGVSIRQISRLTAISKAKIEKALGR